MKVVYFRAADAAGEQHLVIHRLDSGEQIIYDTGQLTWRGWAPDSIRFVYSKGTGLDLYLGELGAAPEYIASGSGLRWINENEYLFLRKNPDSWTLLRVDLSGLVAALANPGGDFVAYDFAD